MDRRHQLLTTALECFLTKGFHGTSTREICRAAGISSGLIFHYFPTKEAIYEELVRAAVTSMPTSDDAALTDPLAHLEMIATTVLDLLAHHPEGARLFLLVNQAQYNRGISASLQELLDEHDLIAELVPVIEAGQSLGQVRAGNSRALAACFLTALQGIAEELAINPRQPLPEAAWYLDLIRPRS